MWNKLSHFYVNKYFVTPFASQKYYISYCFKHKALWFRNYKVASRTIDHVLRDVEGEKNYIYSSQVGYLPKRYRNYFKFAFVRKPEDRFISAWRNLVLQRNYFKFDMDEYNKMKDLENFIKWAKPLNKETCDEHLRAQYSLIDLDHVDFIGYMERFDKDFKYVAQQMGFKYHTPEKKNISLPVIDEVSEKHLDMIREMYKKDMKLFFS